MIHKAMAMTLSQLKTFIAVAEDGSVRAAAERLHVSQPSVSGSIAALSDEVGVALTERDGRGMMPAEIEADRRVQAVGDRGIFQQAKIAEFREQGFPSPFRS